jgi:hypothetical protein
MPPLKKFDMMQATCLTRAGRLKEARGLLLGDFEVTTPQSASNYPAATSACCRREPNPTAYASPPRSIP